MALIPQPASAAGDVPPGRILRKTKGIARARLLGVMSPYHPLRTKTNGAFPPIADISYSGRNSAAWAQAGPLSPCGHDWRSRSMYPGSPAALPTLSSNLSCPDRSSNLSRYMPCSPPSSAPITTRSDLGSRAAQCGLNVWRKSSLEASFGLCRIGDVQHDNGMGSPDWHYPNKS